MAVWDLLFENVNDQPGAVLFASRDGTFLDAVDRPVVVKGRMYNPAAADEVVVDENAQRDVPLGTPFAFQPFAVDQHDESGDPPAGPKVMMHVVGVVREVNEFLFVPDGQVFVSPAFIARYGAQVETAENAVVVLAHGAEDMPALQRDVDAHVAAGSPILDLHAAKRRVDTTLSVERSGLIALALAIALAGGFLVSQALVRSAAVVGDDVLVLRAIGMTRGDVALAGGLPHVLTTAVGVVTALATAAVASDAFPVGLGRAIDPDVGFHADWTIVAPVLLLTAALVLGTSVLVARRAEALREGRPGYPSRLAGWIRPRMPDAAPIEALPEVASVGHLRMFSSAGPNGEDTNAFGSPLGDAYRPLHGVSQARSGRAFDERRTDEVMIDYSVAARDPCGWGARSRVCSPARRRARPTSSTTRRRPSRSGSGWWASSPPPGSSRPRPASTSRGRPPTSRRRSSTPTRPISPPTRRVRSA